ncbi:hypothetical protein Y032_0070g427 [Ancylostoma ceylanicum]|uniref:Uncharacterized protein n=1 Tax=Ancylostoma ceylanicum TaxID=53326 RepID=A0A016TYM0_9BILA|nr:hypothetical protein Y032_0070g427 [Ancylostoma ceylanicum]
MTVLRIPMPRRDLGSIKLETSPHLFIFLCWLHHTLARSRQSNFFCLGKALPLWSTDFGQGYLRLCYIITVFRNVYYHRRSSHDDLISFG